MHTTLVFEEVQRLQLEVKRLQRLQKLMDEWYQLQQEKVNMGETLQPMSFQIMPPTHEHTHSQIAQSAMRNPPVQSHEFQKDTLNMMNPNLALYRVRGETSGATQRSEVGKSHQHAQNKVRRPHARLLPRYSQRLKTKATLEYQMSVTKSLTKSTLRQTSRQKLVKRSRDDSKGFQNGSRMFSQTPV